MTTLSTKSSILALTSLALTLGTNAAVVQIDQLGFNTSGVAFDPTNQANATAQLVNGAAFPGVNVVGGSAPIITTITYNSLDLDGDGTANDSVTFSLNIASAPGLLFNQGFHSNWGTLDGMAVTVSGVSGTTTDNGDTVVFDGFTGAAIGAGNGNATGVDKSVDINGMNASVAGAAVPNGMGGFNYLFLQDYLDFAPTPSLTYSNTASNSDGTLVARNFDLQFSTTPPIPEPSSLALLGLGGLALFGRRR